MAPSATGLSFASKPTPSLQARLAGQKRKKNLFDDPDSDTEEAPNTEEISTLGGLSKPQPASNRPPKSPKLSQSTSKSSAPVADNRYQNLSALHSSRKHDKQAQDLDPSIYDYDTFYEVSKAPERAKESSDGPKESRYMNNLLKSKDLRERDRLRAEEKKIAREREAEGDEFQDKEKFVTGAYKKQQEERREAEEAEAEREKEEEERRKKGQGMRGLYENVLKKEEERREAIQQAERDMAEKKQRGEFVEGENQTDREKTDAEIAMELNKKGQRIAVNDEGEVVDKRQLLGAGLNMARTPKSSGPEKSAASKQAARPTSFAYNKGPSNARRSQVDRQTAMIEEQLLQRHRQEEEAADQERREREEKAKSKKSGTEIMSAKERYLARKREREAETKKGAAG
ncbi:MAG: hypothetical protein Q9227_004318 [Pyrenula ochraceoflavens]